VPEVSGLIIGNNDFDYIQGAGKRIYVYEPTPQENVVINLIPIESDVELYVHPNSMPNDLGHSTWKMESSLAKRLVLTSEERAGLLVPKSKLFIIVSAKQTSSFVLSIQPYFEGEGSIHPGYIESGSVGSGVLKNFLLTVPNDEPSFNRFSVRLHLVSGDAELYFKACDSVVSCKIEDKDLNNANSTPGVRKAINSGSEKEISFPTYCDRHSSKSVIPMDAITTSGLKANQIYRSKSCAFVIGIKSKITEVSPMDWWQSRPGMFLGRPVSANIQKCHYELSVEEQDTDHLLNEKHPMFLRLLPGQWRYYRFHLEHSHSEAVKLDIQIDSLTGFHEVCVAKSEIRPDESKKCFASVAFNSNNQGLFTNYQTIKITKKEAGGKNLEGIYYVVVHSFTYASMY
jgi:hypothetical protein